MAATAITTVASDSKFRRPRIGYTELRWAGRLAGPTFPAATRSRGSKANELHTTNRFGDGEPYRAGPGVRGPRPGDAADAARGCAVPQPAHREPVPQPSPTQHQPGD